MRGRISLTIVLAALVAVFSLAEAEPASPDSIVRVGACATPGITWGVFVQDSFAYVADRNATTIVDISTPSAPFVVSSLSEFSASALGIFVEDTTCYNNLTAVGNRFSVLSISQPTSPYVLGWCDVPGAAGPDPTGVCTIDTITYLANGDDGLGVLDVADPSSPDTIRYYDTPGNALDLSVRDTLVFIADYDSVVIVNVADILNPYRVGAVGMPNSCYGIFVVDTVAYVACQSNLGTDGSLQVVDVSDPALPQIVASVDNINGDPLDVWISGSHAYVVAADYWTSTGGKPRQVGGLRPGLDPGGKADVEGGLRVVDISNPSSPTLVASYNTPGDPRGVCAVGYLAFVADYDSLQILRHIVTGIEEETDRLQAAALRLEQNQPNPFRRFTVIWYELPVPGPIRLRVYDATGGLVKTLVDRPQNMGRHVAYWDRRDERSREVAGGVYFYRLTNQSGSLSKKMLITR